MTLDYIDYITYTSVQKTYIGYSYIRKSKKKVLLHIIYSQRQRQIEEDVMDSVHQRENEREYYYYLNLLYVRKSFEIQPAVMSMMMMM